MKIVNPITMDIIRKVEDGDTVRKVAKKTGFAYSAVYKWVKNLESFGVFDLEKKGNKTIISVNKELVYNKYMELFKTLETVEKNKIFWQLMRKTRYKVRFVRGTAVVIWTRGGYITGDFFDKIYHVEVLEKNFDDFKKWLEKYEIRFGKEDTTPSTERPFVYVKEKMTLKTERVNGLPAMPLKELVSWCRKLHLEPVLEQLDLMYDLGLKVRYSEIYGNV